MGRGLLLTRFTVDELGLSAWIKVSVATSTYMRYCTLSDSGGHGSSNSDSIEDHLDSQQLRNAIYEIDIQIETTSQCKECNLSSVSRY